MQGVSTKGHCKGYYIADLLLEVVDGLPEFFGETICQARHHRQPEILFHSAERLIERQVAGKGFRQTTAQVQ